MLLAGYNRSCIHADLRHAVSCVPIPSSVQATPQSRKLIGRTHSSARAHTHTHFKRMSGRGLSTYISLEDTSAMTRHARVCASCIRAQLLHMSHIRGSLHTHTHTRARARARTHTHTRALLATLIVGRTPVGTARACWLWHSVFGALKEGMLPHEVAQTTMKTMYTFLLIFPRGAGAGTQYYAGG